MIPHDAREEIHREHERMGLLEAVLHLTDTKMASWYKSLDMMSPKSVRGHWRELADILEEKQRTLVAKYNQLYG